MYVIGRKRDGQLGKNNFCSDHITCRPTTNVMSSSRGLFVVNHNTYQVPIQGRGGGPGVCPLFGPQCKLFCPPPFQKSYIHLCIKYICHPCVYHKVPPNQTRASQCDYKYTTKLASYRPVSFRMVMDNLSGVICCSSRFLYASPALCYVWYGYDVIGDDNRVYQPSPAISSFLPARWRLRSACRQPDLWTL